MARAIYPQWPAPPGDEFTFDELMDDIAARQQSIDSKENRDAEFSSYFNALLATPQEARDEEAAEYEKERIRSIWINAQEKLLQKEESDRQAWNAAQEELRHGFSENAPREKGWGYKVREEIMRESEAEAEDFDWDAWKRSEAEREKYLEEEVYYSEPEPLYENTGLPRGEEPPMLVYKDTDLIAASRELEGQISHFTQEDLDWMEWMESEDHPRFTQEDVSAYRDLRLARDQAKAIIDKQIRERKDD